MTSKIDKVFLPISLIFFGVGIYYFVLKDTGTFHIQASFLRSVGHLMVITLIFLIYLRFPTEFRILPKRNPFLTYSTIVFVYFIVGSYFIFYATSVIGL